MNRPADLLKRIRGDVVGREALRETLGDNSRMTTAIDDLRAQVAAQSRQLARLEAALAAPPTIPPARADPQLTEDVGSWRDNAQPGELAFHKRPNERSSERWGELNRALWQRYGFESSDFRGKTIVDVGAGSRLRTLYFEDVRIIAIEPPAQQFIEEVEWNDLDRAASIHALPAENEIPELIGVADFVVSVNALDHGFNFTDTVVNTRKYVKDDGCAFLSFDQHHTPESMHPLVLTDEIARVVFEAAGWRVSKFTEQFRYHGGPGPQALNYWLVPA